MSNELTVVEYKSLSGIAVTLDAETVKKSLTRGKSQVTDQEVAFFLRTCQAKQLDPFEDGEVFLIKFGDTPAQLVVGCNAYLRRAQRFPNYRGMKSGITVCIKKGDGYEIIKKEGSCVYKVIGEILIGGWCRVRKALPNGEIEETFIEVSLEEYNKGTATWKNLPATMINKVAKSQALRTAFSEHNEGLYTIEELEASGKFDNYHVDEKSGEVIEVDATVSENASKEEIKIMFKEAQDRLGVEKGNLLVKELMNKEGIECSSDLTKDAYKRIMSVINTFVATNEKSETNGENAE